jgi:hypothetical protein
MNIEKSSKKLRETQQEPFALNILYLHVDAAGSWHSNEGVSRPMGRQTTLAFRVAR